MWTPSASSKALNAVMAATPGAGDGALRYNTEVNVLELYSTAQSAWLPVGTLSAKTVTTTYSANSGEQLFCDTNGGGFTITLPGSPATGDVIRFYDLRKTFDSNGILNTDSGSYDFIYIANHAFF